MSDLQARIGRKVTQLYPNLTWKRPGAVPQSPSKNTLKSSQAQAHQSDEKDDDASREHASSTFSSPRRQLSLLRRMGLSSDDHPASEGKEAAGIQPSLLSRVQDNTPQPSSSSNTFTVKKHDRPTSGPKPSTTAHNFEEGELVKPSSSTITIEHDFEEGELVESEPLPSQQVRDFLLPLVLKNAAHRVKEGDGDLTRFTARSVLSDEVCSSFMDQMKEVRTEMHAHKNRSSNPPEIQLMGKTNNLGAARPQILPSSKIGQIPPSGPRAMIHPIITDKYKPPNGEMTTTSSLSKDQPISALSNHSHDPVLSSNLERREPEFRHIPSPERKGFHDHDRGRRYSQHREIFGDHRSRSQSHSPSRYSRGQPYHRPSDSSRHVARSPPPFVTSPGRRRSPQGPSQSTYFRDLALRESPEAISGGQSASPSGTSNHNRIPRSLTRDFKLIQKPRNFSPLRDAPRSPISRRPFNWRPPDKVVSPHRVTHERDLEFPGRERDTRSGSEFARRSVSPRRQHYRRLSAEGPLPRTPHPHSPRPTTPNPYYERRPTTPNPYYERRPTTPNPYYERRPTTPNPYYERRPTTPNPYYERHSPRSTSPNLYYERRHSPRSTTPKPYCEPERRRDAAYMESVSPGTGSMSTHLTSRATGSHHPIIPEPTVKNKDMHERVNNEVRPPIGSDDMQTRPSVLPCHNVPGVWFVKVALGDIGTLECSFEVDDVTALKWNLRRANMNLPNDILQEERLQLHVCCLSQKDVQSVMESFKPDATAHDVATAMLEIENNWPTPGHLIIMVNPQDKNKGVWLPHKLESPCLPVCIEDYVVEGQNIVQFIQLSGMSERMFVLFATTRSLSDELHHDDVEEFVIASKQNN